MEELEWELHCEFQVDGKFSLCSLQPLRALKALRRLRALTLNLYWSGPQVPHMMALCEALRGLELTKLRLLCGGNGGIFEAGIASLLEGIPRPTLATLSIDLRDCHPVSAGALRPLRRWASEGQLLRLRSLELDFGLSPLGVEEARHVLELCSALLPGLRKLELRLFRRGLSDGSGSALERLAG